MTQTPPSLNIPEHMITSLTAGHKMSPTSLYFHITLVYAEYWTTIQIQQL